jgi:hypothetical protein
MAPIDGGHAVFAVNSGQWSVVSEQKKTFPVRRRIASLSENQKRNSLRGHSFYRNDPIAKAINDLQFVTNIPVFP